MDTFENSGNLMAIERHTPTATPLQLLQPVFRKLFMKLCRSLQVGQITLTESFNSAPDAAPTSIRLGDPLHCDHELQVHITVVKGDFYRRVVTGGANGAAESYLRGEWQADDLTRLMRVMLANRQAMENFESGFSSLLRQISKIWHATRRNSIKGSRKNIAAHYDLGNDFFKLFLDSRLMYSSALYHSDADSLEQASEQKLQRIVQQLELQASDHLLEIGSGWGGLAIYAAQHSGCRVTTITLSQEQFIEARNRVRQANLEHRVEVRLQDYREVRGQFDKIVSVEMVEAVGHQYLSGYFETIQSLLKPGGKVLIQAITIDDQRYSQALKEVDYIKRYIFPGSFIPCVSLLTSSAARQGLRLFGLHDMGHSYALTLEAWRKQFFAQLDEVRRQGYDQRFIRMWEYYLCYCEGGFRERAISVVQLVLTPGK